MRLRFALFLLLLLGSSLCFDVDDAPADAPAAEASAADAPAEAAEAPEAKPKSAPKTRAAGGGVDFSAIAAFAALIVAIVVPVIMLLRTQKKGEQREVPTATPPQAQHASTPVARLALMTHHVSRLASQDAAQTAAQRKDLEREAKKQAKLERGTGKKKKGGLDRMKAAAGGGDEDDDGGLSGAQAKKAAREAALASEAQVREEGERDKAAADGAFELREGETAKEAAKRRKEEEREARQAARAEAGRLAKEADEKAKQEEYDNWRDMFSVEDAGADAGDEAEDEGLLGRFVGFIKAQKVAVLEDLAGEFGLKAADAVARVQALEAMGYISGVVDDRGKFIYISNDEMAAVAKFIQKKGRVRISTLAQESNKLIDLEPRAVEEDDEPEPEDAAAATGAES